MNGSSPKVVVARSLPEEAGLSLLRARYELDVGGAELDRELLLERVRGAQAIVADPTVTIDRAVLEAAGSSLRVVANFAVGYDNIDVGACAAADVTVTNTPDVLTNATAELTVGLMLAAARRLIEGDSLVRRGEWRGWEPSHHLGVELGGSTIGIVGLGRIGERVAELLRGFSARLLYASRTRKPEVEERLGVEHREFGELLGEVDLLTLHLPLSAETEHLIDAESLARMKPSAIVVNTARGGLIDTAALIAALHSGRLAGAALDVYETEPDVPAALKELPNVVLAPHIGSATGSTRAAMAKLAAENVIAVLSGVEPLTPVTA